MAVSKGDLGSIEEVEAMLTDVLPLVLTEFGAAELVPLVPVVQGALKFITDLIAKKTAIDDPKAVVGAAELGAVAELDAEYVKL